MSAFVPPLPILTLGLASPPLSSLYPFFSLQPLEVASSLSNSPFFSSPLPFFILLLLPRRKVRAELLCIQGIHQPPFSCRKKLEGGTSLPPFLPPWRRPQKRKGRGEAKEPLRRSDLVLVVSLERRRRKRPLSAAGGRARPPPAYIGAILQPREGGRGREKRRHSTNSAAVPPSLPSLLNSADCCLSLARGLSPASLSPHAGGDSRKTAKTERTSALLGARGGGERPRGALPPSPSPPL